MLNLTPRGQTLIAELAAKYGVSEEAVATVLQALVGGTGRAAQFSHPDFGGRCQWMTGGMTMTPDLFNHALNVKVDGLCTDLSAALNTSPSGAASGLYVPGAARTHNPWWPPHLGSPAAAGSQNQVSYALFPKARRLVVEIKGRVTTYDLGEHRISGLTQQQDDDTNLTFLSQHGPLSLTALRILDSSNNPSPDETAPADDTARIETPHDDVIKTIERLAGLKDKGILTPEEFTAKKAELLGRL